MVGVTFLAEKSLVVVDAPQKSGDTVGEHPLPPALPLFILYIFFALPATKEPGFRLRKVLLYLHTCIINSW